MNGFNALLQLFGNLGGTVTTTSCPATTTQTATQAVETVTNALGGISGLGQLFSVFCKLLGLGC